jgi:ribonuclease BN (tRNA processing enzyme)
VRLRDLPNVILHDVAPGSFDIGAVRVTADLVIHPGPTLGYRLEADSSSVAYIPDHELALSEDSFPNRSRWTSGYDLAADTDLLIHDAQYFDDEYPTRVGWGHSTFEHVLAFAEMARASTLVSFHHDPSHTDEVLDQAAAEIADRDLAFAFVPGKAGTTFEV